MRGNPWNMALGQGDGGTIPACAGEPGMQGLSANGSRDYPRVCGGTEQCPSRTSALQGLSPRVRGNLRRVPVIGKLRGTIPACAGEPSLNVIRFRFERDYPRVCGGTENGMTAAPGFAGLSPRVRGNRFQRGRDTSYTGTIPACAGEPLFGRRHHRVHRDYPRVCGGTGSTRSIGLNSAGLSPRVRGNPWNSTGMGIACEPLTIRLLSDR